MIHPLINSRSNRLILIVALLLTFSCSRPTFYQKTYNFNKEIAVSHFDAAEKMIEENKDLEKGKLRFLYYVNAGTVEHLKGDFHPTCPWHGYTWRKGSSAAQHQTSYCIDSMIDKIKT